MTKHSKKSLTYFLLAAVLLAGVYYTYHEGLIPGIGQGRKTADELKTRIEALQGNNIENKIYTMVAKSPFSASFIGDGKEFAKDWDVSLAYSELIPSAEHGNGVVEIVKPVLTITHATRGNFQITMPTLIIAQEPGKEHYFYRVEGDVDLSMDFIGNGDATKMLAIKSEENKGEVIFENGQMLMQKFSGKNLKFVESRGGTTLVSIAGLDGENSQKIEDGKFKYSSKANYTGVEPGDMVKLFIGQSDPLNIAYDYNYEGSPTELNGKWDVKKLSVKFGDAGLEADANLEFKKKNAHPFGTAYLKIVKYAKIIGLLEKAYSVNPADDASLQKFLMEAGADEGDDMSFDLEFNGTEKMRINGKSQEEFEAIFDRNFPKKEAMPIEPVPTVEKKKL